MVLMESFEDSTRDRPGYALASGASVRLPKPGDPLGREDLLAVASAGGLEMGALNNSSISLAAPLDVAELAVAAPQLLQHRTNVFWAPGAKAVIGRRQRCIGAIVLEVCPFSDRFPTQDSSGAKAKGPKLDKVLLSSSARLSISCRMRTSIIKMCLTEKFDWRCQ